MKKSMALTFTYDDEDSIKTISGCFGLTTEKAAMVTAAIHLTLSGKRSPDPLNTIMGLVENGTLHGDYLMTMALVQVIRQIEEVEAELRKVEGDAPWELDTAARDYREGTGRLPV